MAKEKLNYSDAVAELQAILTHLESNTELNMDKITEKVKRAAELMKYCKKHLHEMDEEMEKILENLD